MKQASTKAQSPLLWCYKRASVSQWTNFHTSLVTMLVSFLGFHLLTFVRFPL